MLEIVTYPNDVLKKKSARVDAITLEIIEFIKQMYEALAAYHGLGLAAPQVGVSKRIIVYDMKKKSKDGTKDIANPEAMINPEITWSSEELEPYDEGCLSLPGITAEVIRPAKVKVKWTNTKGKEFEKEFDGLMAVMLQHEIDHLDGIVYIDRLSRLKKNMAIKRYNKRKEDGYDGEEEEKI